MRKEPLEHGSIRPPLVSTDFAMLNVLLSTWTFISDMISIAQIFIDFDINCVSWLEVFHGKEN